MPNRIVDVVDALNAAVASGEDVFVTVMDDGGSTGTFARDNWESLPAFCYSRDRLAFWSWSNLNCNFRIAVTACAHRDGPAKVRSIAAGSAARRSTLHVREPADSTLMVHRGG